jgi:methionine synthase II (cobalamin-independent)
MNAPYRAEHIGSLPLPERLRPLGQLPKRAISRADLVRVEDECCRGDRNAGARGIDVITDGEYRKRGWREFFYDKVEGSVPETVEREFPGDVSQMAPSLRH